MFTTIGIATRQRPEEVSRSRRGQLRAIGLSTFLVAGLAATISPASPVAADGGEYKLDFTAAAPRTYDHTKGGGAFDQRDVGVDKDIVESLEGGDFQCGETVTYLTQIRRDFTGTDTDTIELQYSFLADTTGQSGVAMVEVLRVQINSDPDGLPGLADPVGEGVGGSDAGITDVPPDAQIAFWSGTQLTGALFTKGSYISTTVKISGLDPGDRTVLRVDVLLDCNAGGATGNLQAQLDYGKVVVDGSGEAESVIPGGVQTVPFKQAGKVYPLQCPEGDEPYAGNDAKCPTGNIVNASFTTEQSTSTSSTTDTKKGTPVLSAVTEAVGTNPEVSSAFAVGGLIGLVALRRRSAHLRRTSP